MNYFRHLTYGTCQMLPFISAIMATILCGILLMLDMIHSTDRLEEAKILYETAVVTVGFALVFALSWIMKFCWYQLLGILYTYVFLICVWLCRYTEGRYGIFGDHIILVHAILFGIGILYTASVICLLRKRRNMELQEE